MNEFKVNRFKYEQNQYLLRKIKENKNKQHERHKINRFFHNLGKKSVNEVLMDLSVNNPTYQSIQLPSQLSTDERMDMIQH